MFQPTRPVLAILLAVLLSGPALAAAPAPKDVVIVNRAPSPIEEVYVSAPSDDSWGDNRLGGDPVAPGRSWRLTSALRSCAADIRVVYSDGRTEERRGLDVCRNREVAFDASTAAVPHAEGTQRVIIANSGTRTITELYLSAPTSNDWGDDVLTHKLAPGAQARIDHEGGCVADLRVIYDNRAAEERRRIDICRNAQVAIKPGWTTSDDLAPPDNATAGVRPDRRT